MTRYLYNFFRNNENISIVVENLSDDIENKLIELKILYEECPPSMIYRNNQEYLDSLFKEIGLEEWEFKMADVKFYELVCERSTTMPIHYIRLMKILENYQK